MINKIKVSANETGTFLNIFTLLKILGLFMLLIWILRISDERRISRCYDIKAKF
jgi:hypothetical protein